MANEDFVPVCTNPSSADFFRFKVSLPLILFDPASSVLICSPDTSRIPAQIWQCVLKHSMDMCHVLFLSTHGGHARFTLSDESQIVTERDRRPQKMERKRKRLRERERLGF